MAEPEHVFLGIFSFEIHLNDSLKGHKEETHKKVKTMGDIDGPESSAGFMNRLAFIGRGSAQSGEDQKRPGRKYFS